MSYQPRGIIYVVSGTVHLVFSQLILEVVINVPVSAQILNAQVCKRMDGNMDCQLRRELCVPAYLQVMLFVYGKVYSLDTFCNVFPACCIRSMYI